MKVWSNTPGLGFLDVHTAPSPQGSHQKPPWIFRVPPGGNSAQTHVEITVHVHVEAHGAAVHICRGWDPQASFPSRIS